MEPPPPPAVLLDVKLPDQGGVEVEEVPQVGEHEGVAVRGDEMGADHLARAVGGELHVGEPVVDGLGAEGAGGGGPGAGVVEAALVGGEGVEGELVGLEGGGVRGWGVRVVRGGCVREGEGFVVVLWGFVREGYGLHVQG